MSFTAKKEIRKETNDSDEKISAKKKSRDSRKFQESGFILERLIDRMKQSWKSDDSLKLIN